MADDGKPGEASSTTTSGADAATGDAKASGKTSSKASGKASGKADDKAAGKAAGPTRAERRAAASDAKVVPDGDGPRRRGGRLEVANVRVQVARVVGFVFLVLAVVLAAAALFIALDANRDNALVGFVLDTADAIDLGIFDLDNPLFPQSGANAETKEALITYGLGALAYLVVGRILERVIRP